MHQPSHFPDPFAVEWGHDEFGTFQSFAVGNVVQRMRWIPPGRFMMGSPETEVWRYADEFQHQVWFAKGFWLADTPVTHALWQIVMGTHPSQFKEATQPVEPVTWDDCQKFCRRLNQGTAGLYARLPSEAEWEYACRAGTTTTTWAGELLSGQEIVAPQLDAIAWYSGNAGATGHPVAQKAPNPWGLFDMLGNVWEWCYDEFNYYPTDPASVRDTTIAVPQRVNPLHVLRGGGWDSSARFLRAACRYADRADSRSRSIGFRLARSATPKYPIER